MTQAQNDQNDYDHDAEFRHEAEHLGVVVGTIDAEVQDKANRGPITAVDSRSADIAQSLRDINLDDLRRVRGRPYFGRVDCLITEEEGTRSIYIGDINIQNEDPEYLVVSRNAPIARLYYRPTDGYYETPPDSKRRRDRRRHNATVLLKRGLVVEEAQLLDFEDVLRLPPGFLALQSSSSRMLDQKLSGPSGEHLPDAVQTIQPDQYEQIAATLSPVMLVQGAAGSGKSLIGLHRIDFILSPFSDVGRLSRPTAERVIMFGPSPAFLQYVASLLPGLGVHGVKQITVTEWLLKQFSSRVTLRRGDRIFNDLMNNRRKQTEAETAAHLFKSGLKMRRVLDNYVSQIGKDLKARITSKGTIYIPGVPPLELNSRELSQLTANAFKAHPQPNLARRYLVDGLAAEWARLQRRRTTPQFEMVDRARRAIGRDLDALWPILDFRTEYSRLLSSPNNILAHARRGDLGPDEARELSWTAPTGAGRAMGITDLAAALYLDYAINGFTSERFEHVIIDEAQDVSPLEMLLMQMHSTNNTFTILGDLRQSILPYKSIKNWNEHVVLFPSANVTRFESRQTRRSTKQITQYANRILQGLPKRAKMPVPYQRNGPRPLLVRSRSAAEMKLAIAESVDNLSHAEGIRSVAVLTKWEQTAHDISRTLADKGIDGVGVLTQDGLIESDITVSPIVLTKGLEFDAVIVANVHKDNFNESDFDKLLLYLACTRARHRLEIHWYGTRSPIVPDVSRLASGSDTGSRE